MEPTSLGRQTLVGRERECGLLDGMLAALTHRGSALLLRGDPGMGKSVLLDYAARESGMGELKHWIRSSISARSWPLRGQAASRRRAAISASRRPS